MSNVITLELLGHSWLMFFGEYLCMGPSGHFYSFYSYVDPEWSLYNYWDKLCFG